MDLGQVTTQGVLRLVTEDRPPVVGPKDRKFLTEGRLLTTLIKSP